MLVVLTALNCMYGTRIVVKDYSATFFLVPSDPENVQATLNCQDVTLNAITVTWSVSYYHKSLHL